MRLATVHSFGSKQKAFVLEVGLKAMPVWDWPSSCNLPTQIIRAVSCRIFSFLPGSDLCMTTWPFSQTTLMPSSDSSKTVPLVNCCKEACATSWLGGTCGAIFGRLVGRSTTGSSISPPPTSTTCVSCPSAVKWPVHHQTHQDPWMAKRYTTHLSKKFPTYPWNIQPPNSQPTVYDSEIGIPFTWGSVGDA